MRKLKETVADVPFLMEEWDFEANSAQGLFPEKLGSQSNEPANWKCRYGHRWPAKINNRYNGRGCPECRKRLKTSFPEQALYFYVKQKFPDAVNAYKDIFTNGMELDVYIPSIKTGIEYDGVAWHLEKTLDREQKKYTICKENGITLYRLKENLDHYTNDQKVADAIIPVRRAFMGKQESYFYLDYAIREMLYVLLDFEPSDYFLRREPGCIEQYIDALRGPEVKTDVNSKRDRNKILESYLAGLEKNSLGAQYPDIARLWHPQKNGELNPFMFPPHSGIPVWWLGECGHEWENPITVVTRGEKCPYCSGQRVLKGFNDLETKFPEIAAQWHPTENGGKTPDMYTAGSEYHAIWLCPVCHQSWKAKITNRTANHRGCPYCAHLRPIIGVNDLATLRPDLLKEWDYEKNKDLNPSEYLPSSNKNVWWTCSQCGYEYRASINNRNKGTGCKQCAGQVLLPGVNDLETLYPVIAAEWDYEKNNGKRPSEVFPKTNDGYWWKCELGHSWKTSPNSQVSGRGCPYCSGNKVLAGFNDIATTHPEIARLWHPSLNEDLLPTQVSKGYTKKVWLLCPNCHNAYDTLIGNYIKGYGRCPTCSPRKTRARYVYQVETGKYFNTLKEAAQAVGKKDASQIQMCCRGRCQTASGFHWEYRDKPAEE